MLNDPTFLGWLTTGMYVATGVLCACAAYSPDHGMTVHRSVQRRLRAFWILLAVVLAGLAINKQLDLQTALTNMLRDDAELRGWYQQRRVLQIVFVACAIFAAAFGSWLLYRLLGPQWRVHRLALCGMLLLVLYLLLRVADIERAGEMLSVSLTADYARTALEWTGLICISIAAWKRAVGATTKP